MTHRLRGWSAQAFPPSGAGIGKPAAYSAPVYRYLRTSCR